LGENKVISLLVTGGEANAGPPLGPALGPFGVNVVAVVKRINELTGDYSGMRVPVKVSVDIEEKSFEVEVGLPTTSALIAKEASIHKGSGTPQATFAGNLTVDQLLKLAKIKFGKTYATTYKSASREILGACVSMGITVEGKDPRLFLKEVEEGKWDQALAGQGS